MCLDGQNWERQSWDESECDEMTRHQFLVNFDFQSHIMFHKGPFLDGKFAKIWDLLENVVLAYGGLQNFLKGQCTVILEITRGNDDWSKSFGAELVMS